jgi:endonuclease I
MHNIYLTNYYTNNLRSNKKFSHASHYVDENIGKKVYVPCSNSRGIIARTLAYMKYTYPLLNLSNVIDTNIILLWNELYPPTELELKKNDIIYNYQGNKNIFIEDYKILTQFINNNFKL